MVMFQLLIDIWWALYDHGCGDKKKMCCVLIRKSRPHRKCIQLTAVFESTTRKRTRIHDNSSKGLLVRRDSVSWIWRSARVLTVAWKYAGARSFAKWTPRKNSWPWRNWTAIEAWFVCFRYDRQTITGSSIRILDDPGSRRRTDSLIKIQEDPDSERSRQMKTHMQSNPRRLSYRSW